MTDCRPWRDDDNGVMNSLLERAIANRIPLNGYFALTHRCNLKCRHCYLGCQEEIRRNRDKELSFEQIANILDQLVDASTLGIIFTGGEPLLHPEFKRIYEYTAKKGFLITLMSNATLVTPEIIKLFEKYPPRVVEVSMYGATGETYEKITQLPGSYDRFTKGVDLLHSNSIRFLLKSVLMKRNQHELSQIEEIAKHYGVSYHYDTAIFPAIPHEDNGGKSNVPVSLPGKEHKYDGLFAPVEERISCDEISKIDFGTPERQQMWQKIYNHEKDKQLSKKLITCFAALTTFHINPYGFLQPCMLMPSTDVDLKHSSFVNGWNGSVAAVRDIVAPPEFPCSKCEARPVCATCPAMVQLETGKNTEISRYICDIAQERVEIIKKTPKKRKK